MVRRNAQYPNFSFFMASSNIVHIHAEPLAPNIPVACSHAAQGHLGVGKDIPHWISGAQIRWLAGLPLPTPHALKAEVTTRVVLQQVAAIVALLQIASHIDTRTKVVEVSGGPLRVALEAIFERGPYHR